MEFNLDSISELRLRNDTEACQGTELNWTGGNENMKTGIQVQSCVVPIVILDVMDKDSTLKVDSGWRIKTFRQILNSISRLTLNDIY